MEIKATAALVTGGASGLGEATVRRLTKLGAQCTILDRNSDKGEQLAKELGGNTKFINVDVADEKAVEEAVSIAGESAPLRIAVNCAGIGWVGRTINKDSSPHDMGAFTKVLEVNLIGTFNVMRWAASAIAKTEPLEFGERGVIINTASIAAFDGQIGQLAYSASKGGIVGMTLPAARDLAAVGIRVNTIAPGLMDTPLLALLPEPQRQALAAGVNFPKRLGFGDDYASLVQQICENGYLNGETIRLDGGLRMPPK